MNNNKTKFYRSGAYRGFILLFIFLFIFSPLADFIRLYLPERVAEVVPEVQEAKAASGDIIVFWDGDNGATPAGWTLLSGSGGVFENRFPLASASAGINGGTADSTGHTPTTSSVVVGAATNSTTRNKNTGTGFADDLHNHTSPTVTIGKGPTRPKWGSLAMISQNGATSVPQNAIMMFDAALSGDWVSYTDINDRIIIASASNQAQTTGGADTHNHTVTIGTLSGGVAQVAAKNSGANTASVTAHTHTVNSTTTGTLSHVPPHTSVILGRCNNAGGCSISGNEIAMFDATPPEGWSTLSDSGGAFSNAFLEASTSYSAVTSNAGTKSHTHANVVQTSSTTSTTGSSGNGNGTSGQHTHDVTVTFNATNDHRPLFRTVIVAKKVIAAITVAASDTQKSVLKTNSTDQYIGGAFTFVGNSVSADVTQIKITEGGTVNADSNLSNVKFYYKQEATCSSSIPGDATAFNGTGVGFSSNVATATGTMSVGSSQICVYVQMNIGSGAADLENLEIEISNPSADITVSAGTVSPGTAVAISGTSLLNVGSPVQRGSQDMGLSTIVDITLAQEVDTSKSFIIAQSRSQTSNTTDIKVAVSFINGGAGIRLERDGIGAGVTVEWQVIEHSALSVEHGVIGTSDLGTAVSSFDKTITDVGNTNKAFVVITNSGTDINTDYNRQQWAAKLTSTTNLNVSRSITGSVSSVSYQIIKFTDATTVEHDTITISDTATSGTAPISEVTIADSFIWASWRSTDTSAPGESLPYWEFDSTTQISATRLGTAGETVVELMTISLPSSAITQVQSIADVADPTNQTITAVSETNNTATFVAATSSAAPLDRVLSTSLLTSTTNVEVRVGDTAVTTTARLFVIELPEASSGITVSGNIYDTDETSVLTSYGGQVKLVVGAATAYTTDASSGVFSFSSVTQPSNGDMMTIWLNDGTASGSLVFKYGTSCSGGNCTGRNIIKSRVAIDNKHTGSMVNSDFAACDNNTGAECSNTNIGFTSESNTLTLTWATNELYASTSVTYAPGGNVNAQKLDVKGTYTGGSETIALSGTGTSTICTDATQTPLCIGGTFTPSSNTVQYTGTTANIAATTYNNLTAGGTGTYTIAGNVTVSGQARINQSATLGINSGQTLTLNGTGTPFLIFSTSTFSPNSASTVEYKGTSASTVAATTYGNLSLTPAGTVTYTLASASGQTMDVNGTFTIGNGTNPVTVTASTNNPAINLFNNFTIANNAVFTKGTGTITFKNGASQTLTDSTSSKQDLGEIRVSVNGTNTSLLLGSDIKISSASIDASQTLDVNGSNTITITGDGDVFTNNGTFSPRTGTVIYTGSTTNIGASKYTNITLGGSGAYTLPSAGTTTILGNFAITDGATVASGSATLFFQAGGSQSITDSSSGTKQNLGEIAIMASTSGNTTLTLGSSIRIASASVDASQTLDSNGSNTLTITNTATPLTVNGTFTRSTGTVAFTGDGATNIPSLNYYNLNLSPSANDITFTFLSGTASASGTFTVGNGTNTGVSIDANANDTGLDVANVTISANSTLIAPPSSEFTIAGNLTNNGSFTHSSGTVTLAGTGASTSEIRSLNEMTFNNLTSTVAGKTIKFEAGKIFLFAGTMTLTGEDGTPINLESVTPGTQWLVDFDGSQSSVTYTTIKDSGCVPASALATLGTGMVDGGNNGVCWFRYPLVVSKVGGGGGGSGGGNSGGGQQQEGGSPGGGGEGSGDGDSGGGEQQSGGGGGGGGGSSPVLYWMWFWPLSLKRFSSKPRMIYWNKKF